MSDLDQFARIAEQTVDAAVHYLRAAAAAERRIQYKSPLDLVTDTDRAVEALMLERLGRAFPDHLIVGEEGSAGRGPARPAAGQYAWYVDPLDGTTNFAHGHPHFAVSLGLARDGVLVFGLVADPLRGETFAAARGRGATLNGRPIRVSAEPELGRALLATGLPYDRRDHADYYLGVIRAFVLRAQGIRRAGSAALDLCYLACGRFDAYWEYKLSPWDTAAGVLIVREAGGIVTDFAGQPFDLYGQQTLASNGPLHPAMIEVLQATACAAGTAGPTSAAR
jgi:myo-inositol-1(or 4)-monophosphatase